MPLASETHPGPEGPHPDFSPLPLGHSQRQGRPKRARSERRRERERASSPGGQSKELKEGKGGGRTRMLQPIGREHPGVGIQSSSI